MRDRLVSCSATSGRCSECPASRADEPSGATNLVDKALRIKVDDRLPTALHRGPVRKLVAPDVSDAVGAILTPEAVALHDGARGVGRNAKWNCGGEAATPLRIA